MQVLFVYGCVWFYWLSNHYSQFHFKVYVFWSIVGANSEFFAILFVLQARQGLAKHVWVLGQSLCKIRVICVCLKSLREEVFGDSNALVVVNGVGK